MFWFIFLVGAVSILVVLLKSKPKHNYLSQLQANAQSDDQLSQAVDLTALFDLSLKARILTSMRTAYHQLGKMAGIKIIALTSLCLFSALYIKKVLSITNLPQTILLFLLFEVVCLVLGYNWLRKKAYTRFSDSFPEALNILGSAVSSGESVIHAMEYVGKNLEGELGEEFKIMAERLLIGEQHSSVLRKSCIKFPYPTFIFFAIVMNANIERGGALKSVVKRINRIIFNERAAEKKKLALTAEVRSSIKIVASVPFIFLFFYQYISPENFHWLMENEIGHYVLYYVIASNTLGVAFAKYIMRD
ncbi:type II secretion system F family protein [Vibrio sp. S4M6]|uniref:type II secretion system F family protein n=1 Tax=Vibrio sinus TaxID=2946865 RepID=UPI002029BDAF|nr:type II secretion system F family protein [Vibrio sinus]MCL9783353.1 type II secretion system F family protein [Vibrio sinus]